MKKTIAVSIVVLCVQACSSGVPSQSEIERAVLEKYAPNGSYDSRKCQRISIENIKKTNGIKVDDSTHQIAVKYDIRIVPVTGYAETLAGLDAKQKDLEQQDQAAYQEIRRLVDKEDLFMAPTLDRMSAEMRPVGEREQALRGLLAENRKKLEETVKALTLGWGNGSEDCFRTANLIFGFKYDALATGDVKTLQQQMTLQKTDNGWLEAN